MHSTARRILESPRRRTANINDLEALIGQLRPELRGTGALKSRAKRSYHWFAELAARGFTEVRAPLGAHAHLQWLAFGETKSISTIKRSFAELEQQGFIKRRKCRRGDISHIDIEVSHFNFYIKRNRRFVEPPCGTFAYPSVHGSSCAADEITDTSGFNNSLRSYDVTTSKLSKKNANKKKEFSEWDHPLVYTIGVLCFHMGKATRELMQKAALCAIMKKVPPFDYWTAERWQAMGIPMREKIGAELLPWLAESADRIDETLKRKESPPPKRKESPPPRRQESPPPPRYEPDPNPVNTPDQDQKIDKFFLDYANRMKIPLPHEMKEKAVIVQENPVICAEEPETQLTAAEFEILSWANKNKVAN